MIFKSLSCVHLLILLCLTSCVDFSPGPKDEEPDFSDRAITPGLYVQFEAGPLLWIRESGDFFKEHNIISSGVNKITQWRGTGRDSSINFFLENVQVRNYRDTNDVWSDWGSITDKKYFKKEVTDTSFYIGTKELDESTGNPRIYYNWISYNKIGEITDTLPTNYQF